VVTCSADWSAELSLLVELSLSLLPQAASATAHAHVSRKPPAVRTAACRDDDSLKTVSLCCSTQRADVDGR
jgi:hypothetical protein